MAVLFSFSAVLTSLCFFSPHTNLYWPIHFCKCHLQAYFAANAAAQASRKSSPRVTNEEVQKAVSTWGSKAYTC